MKNSSPTPPTLKPTSQCVKILNFAPVSYWPKGLPGVSINNVQIAGFDQDLVLDHQIEKSRPDQIADLFTSLYSELSIDEINRLQKACQDLEWFPFALVAGHYQVKNNLVAQNDLSNLPWPGASQVKWTQQGDRAGIEIKIFVSNPTDLKKYLNSLNHVHDIMEKDSEKIWIKH